MNIIYEEKLKTDNISGQILRILTDCGNEFVPPLASRKSTTQSDLTGSYANACDIPYEYFESLKKQHLLIAEDGGIVMGFMSFKENHVTDIITNRHLPNIYISTVIADKNFRRQGVTKALYQSLLEKYKDKNIFTRTWSANVSHIKLLTLLGFAEFKRIPDDRGNGIDTVYFVSSAVPRL